MKFLNENEIKKELQENKVIKLKLLFEHNHTIYCLINKLVGQFLKKKVYFKSHTDSIL